ncbi:hypothetical protein Pla123a_22250 [Posidoniimonas polymericola]|uniref:DUF559 domain-containing protein n=1 Tax=Posidoniimonas polymericola TaxID=2528002 RepID=A0A5C5YRH6_9BACT|nr:endonuclease domain-containing protein [Posidoniimonas polymericola]TWT77564.1 hypothetical protein Pla123a_22250 [Posidoniimonas polymericola]
MYRDRNQRDFARKLRCEMTEEERLLWRGLQRRQLGGLKFRRQAAIGAYIVDFACFDRRIIVKLDGGQHNDPAKRQYGEQRSAWLRT